MRFLLLIIISCLLCLSASALAKDELCQEPLKQLVNFDRETYAFKGLNSDGLEVIKQTRDILRVRKALFESEIRNATTAHHAGIVNRIFQGNMFLYGPPGGAKSGFVNWLMSAETQPLFKLQMHQMITEQAFIGGQNFEAAKEGRFEINTTGSLVDHSIALIDEIDKGNPAALASLLSLLNEREVLIGGKVVKAKLESLFSTSNANLGEFFQQFVENGQGSTAPALLDRFQFKAFTYNWLPLQDQAALDLRRAKKRYLQALSITNPEVLKHELFLKPEPLSWAQLRQLAFTVIKPSDLFMITYRKLAEDMRNLNNQAIKESEERHQQNHLDEPFIYFPSAGFTERLRQQIPEIVVVSAFLDLLDSPLLQNDKSLEALFSKQIELDPISLWRAYLVMTTIGPGETKLTFDPKADQKLGIDFGWSVNPSSARDKREELMIKNLRAEQERFRSTFLKHMTAIREKIEERARFTSDNSKAISFDSTSFELLLLRKKGI